MSKPIYRHGIVARVAHWSWTLAILVLVMSGLQIFNAAPYLDASDKSERDGRGTARRHDPLRPRLSDHGNPRLHR
jgi:hypothetical protein